MKKVKKFLVLILFFIGGISMTSAAFEYVRIDRHVTVEVGGVFYVSFSMFEEYENIFGYYQAPGSGAKFLMEFNDIRAYGVSGITPEHAGLYCFFDPMPDPLNGVYHMLCVTLTVVPKGMAMLNQADKRESQILHEELNSCFVLEQKKRLIV